MKPVCIGGRIKSAAVGLDYLYEDADDIVLLEKRLRSLREHPPEELRKAFFPIAEERLRQVLRGAGLYRSMLKTDQGMAGTFSHFRINTALQTSDLSTVIPYKEEIVAIEESWYPHDPDMAAFVRECLVRNDLDAVRERMSASSDLSARREAGKGRLPIFFVRPMLLDRPLIFGMDIMNAVTSAVHRLMEATIEKAREFQWNYHRESNDFLPNVIYCQPDVFILSDGTVAVERIHYPDVGFFLRSLSHSHSAESALAGVQQVVGLLEEHVCATIVQHMQSRTIALVTRDEVVLKGEDTLEIREIERLEQLLRRDKILTRVYPLSEVPTIPFGSSALLMNIDYRVDGADALLARHCRGELACYPNPFMQIAGQSVSGLEERVIDPKYQSRFLQLIGSTPKGADALRMTWYTIERVLFQQGIACDIVHADIGTEIVPIFRRSLHSWRQLKNRIERYPHEKPVIRLRLVPATSENLLIKSAAGARLHSFRFMFVAS